ncbi:sulfotransferase [Maricaulis sp. CAU 1757]
MEDGVREAIAEANGHIRAGAHGEACLALARALDFEPGLAKAHYTIGALFLMSGRAPEALPPLLTAAQLQPDNPAHSIALARVLHELGKPDRAARCLAVAAARQPGDVKLQQAIAEYPAARNVDAASGLFDRDEASDVTSAALSDAERTLGMGPSETVRARLEELMWLRPDDAGLWSLLARTGTGEAAEMCARRALALAPRDSANWLLLHQILLASHVRTDCAERVLESGLRHCGAVPALASALAGWRITAGRREIALKHLDAMIEGQREPDPALLAVLVSVCDRAGETARARQAIKDGLAKWPGQADLVGAALAFHDRHREPDAVLAVLDAAEQAGCILANGEADDARGRARLAQGDLEAARRSIESALEAGGNADQRRSRLFSLAGIANRQGRHDEAWELAGDANRLLEQVAEIEGACDSSRIGARLEHLRRHFNAHTANYQDNDAAVDAGRDLAFLVGFPRSGTTLLDTILRSHSGVAVIEERPVLADALRSVVPGPTGDEGNFTPDWLDAVLAADATELARAYRVSLNRHCAAASSVSVHVDKLPLNMHWAPLIHRMFPAATFILAHRHPLDVAVSNYFQDYRPNHAMLNMTRLDRISRLYDASFSFWKDFVAACEPPSVTVRYERLVEDLEGEIRPVMRRLDLDWQPPQKRFFETARRRDHIATPSAGQVVQPLYTSARERWRRHEQHVAGPDSEALRTWAQRLDYPV